MENYRDTVRTPRQAAQVRLVIEGMSGYLVAVEPVPIPVPEPQVGWDSEGNYHDSTLRVEHTNG